MPVVLIEQYRLLPFYLTRLREHIEASRSKMQRASWLAGRLPFSTTRCCLRWFKVDPLTLQSERLILVGLYRALSSEPFEDGPEIDVALLEIEKIRMLLSDAWALTNELRSRFLGFGYNNYHRECVHAWSAVEDLRWLILNEITHVPQEPELPSLQPDKPDQDFEPTVPFLQSLLFTDFDALS